MNCTTSGVGTATDYEYNMIPKLVYHMGKGVIQLLNVVQLSILVLVNMLHG
jgi:hypothetical protein